MEWKAAGERYACRFRFRLNSGRKSANGWPVRYHSGTMRGQRGTRLRHGNKRVKPFCRGRPPSKSSRSSICSEKLEMAGCLLGLVLVDHDLTTPRADFAFERLPNLFFFASLVGTSIRSTAGSDRVRYNNAAGERRKFYGYIHSCIVELGRTPVVTC
jgi:hypothetical protein